MGIEKKDIKKILIKGVNWIGDAVITMPVIAAVRANFPEAFIGLVVNKEISVLWQDFPSIDRIYLEEEKREIKKQNFDLGIILPQSFSSAFKMFLYRVKYRVGYPTELRGFLLTHQAPLPDNFREKHLLEEYFDILRSIDLKIIDKTDGFPLKESTKNKAGEFLKAKGIQTDNFIIGICPGATYGPAKKWFIERYLEVIKYLTKTGNTKIILFGGQRDEAVKYILKETNSNAIISNEDKNILESAALISFCKLFISNDTGPMHIAAAIKVPVTAIFGSTNPIWTAPLGAGNTVLYNKIECSPCYDRECIKNKVKYECFDKISADDVIKSLKIN